MSFLAPKLVITPLLIASASLAGRRWGPATTGWLVALPLTSGPIFVFIALELGTGPATAAASGSLAGAVGQVGFALGYAAVARRGSWPTSLLAGSAAFAATVGVLPSEVPALLYALTILAAAAAVPLLLAGTPAERRPAAAPGRWDIPARALVATALVVGISSIAPIIGGHAAGILATFPVYAAVLTTFAHRTTGAAEARAVLLGLVAGMPGFATFFVLAPSLLPTVGLGLAVVSGLMAAMALNIALLAGLRRLLTRRLLASAD